MNGKKCENRKIPKVTSLFYCKIIILAAPELEVCNKTLFEQLRDNREAKKTEMDEAKKFSTFYSSSNCIFIV